MSRSRILPLAVGLALAVTVAGCGGGDDGSSAGTTSSPTQSEPAPSPPEPVELWPAPRDAMKLTIKAGLTPERREHLAHHVHAHLDVFVDGRPVVVPAGIGIDIDNPGVKEFQTPEGGVAYGGIENCRTPCISPLHTHDPDGILHTEAKSHTANTLGQFFDEWGVRLDDSCIGEYCEPEDVGIYLDGDPYEGDPRAIELADRLEIAVVIGTPPAEIPDTADFSNV